MTSLLALLAILAAPLAHAGELHLAPRPTGTGSMVVGPYTYDDVGNITDIGSDHYVYDLLGRLTSGTANGPSNLQMFQYDPFGNRTGVTRAGSPCTAGGACEQAGAYQTSTNHLNNNNAGYDQAGNLAGYGTDRYVYDAAGMLSRASVAGQEHDYIYTASDERVAVYDRSANWRWTIRGEDGKVLRELTSSNNGSTLGVNNRQWTADYVWRDGLLLATENRKPDGSTVSYRYHLDHLGTPRLITDAAGQKVSTHTYYPFGAELAAAAELPETVMKFTGHERDLTGGSDALDDMHARYYASLQGRFLRPDPVIDLGKASANPQMWNRYAYVLNNPLLLTDPDGKNAVPQNQIANAQAQPCQAPYICPQNQPKAQSVTTPTQVIASGVNPNASIPRMSGPAASGPAKGVFTIGFSVGISAVAFGGGSANVSLLHSNRIGTSHAGVSMTGTVHQLGVGVSVYPISVSLGVWKGDVADQAGISKDLNWGIKNWGGSLNFAPGGGFNGGSVGYSPSPFRFGFTNSESGTAVITGREFLEKLGIDR